MHLYDDFVMHFKRASHDALLKFAACVINRALLHHEGFYEFFSHSLRPLNEIIENENVLHSR